eukprot:5834071-Amphidinium_carterae.1
MLYKLCVSCQGMPRKAKPQPVNNKQLMEKVGTTQRSHKNNVSSFVNLHTIRDNVCLSEDSKYQNPKNREQYFDC